MVNSTADLPTLLAANPSQPNQPCRKEMLAGIEEGAIQATPGSVLTMYTSSGAADLASSSDILDLLVRKSIQVLSLVVHFQLSSMIT